MIHKPWTTVAVLLALAATTVLADGAVPAAAPPVNPSPADVVPPLQCLLLERNHGACVNCCKELSGLPGNVCSHFCSIPVPPPPPPEPQP